MDQILPLLPSLDQKTILALLTQAAESHADVRASISTAIAAKRDREASRVINFNWMSGSVWREINVAHSHLRGSKQYNVSGEVYDHVVDTIESIRKQCGPFASAGTRFNGLSVLRKIGKTICLSGNDVVGHRVQNLFQGESLLDEAMLGIVSAMKPEERIVIREDESSSEALWPKLVELEELSKEYCVFDGLHKVLEALEGDYEEEGDYPEDDDDDDDDSDEYEEEDENNQPEQVTFWVPAPSL
ncbi:hypothetical protein BJX76DRAFT_349216 [Aspergillus varians]